MTGDEAQWFLESVTSHGSEPALFTIRDDNKRLSVCLPPNKNGGPKEYTFIMSDGTLRGETIVEQAATWRLHTEFRWPLDRLIVESPDVPYEGDRLRREALDILLLEHSSGLRSEMTLAEVRSRVGVEVKETPKKLDDLLRGMRACQGEVHPGHAKSAHQKCKAIDVLRPRLFLAVAAAEDWRLFTVVRRDDRAVLGKRLPTLDRLYFA